VEKLRIEVDIVDENELAPSGCPILVAFFATGWGF
jgi:hypothetical protein